MLKAELFDKLVCRCVIFLYDSDVATQEYIARCIRDDSRPFGGIQVTILSSPNDVLWGC